MLLCRALILQGRIHMHLIVMKEDRWVTKKFMLAIASRYWKGA
jgi:hypothetical protein